MTHYAFFSLIFFAAHFLHGADNSTVHELHKSLIPAAGLETHMPIF